jgi:hypothetical protein
MASSEKWTMGAESVGGARRRFRRQKEKLQTKETEPLAVRGMYRAIDTLTRITAHVDEKANEDLLRSVGNTLTDEQRERLRVGVPAFKFGKNDFDEVRFDGTTWMYSFGQKDFRDTAPEKMYRATPTERGVDWEQMTVGIDSEFKPFEPNLDDVKLFRSFAEDAAKTALQP